MDRLEGEEHTYVSTDSGAADPRSRDNILNNFMAAKELKLKVDAQVDKPLHSYSTQESADQCRVPGHDD